MTDQEPMAHVVTTVIAGAEDDVRLYSMKLQAATDLIDRERVSVNRFRLDVEMGRIELEDPDG